MAESIYEWDCDNIKQMCRDLASARDNLTQYVKMYGDSKSNLSKSWISIAGDVAKKKTDMDFTEMEEINKEATKQIEILNRVVDSYYLPCEREITEAYNRMQGTTGGGPYGGGGGGGFR